jgi:hypothetical protein
MTKFVYGHPEIPIPDLPRPLIDYRAQLISTGGWIQPSEMYYNYEKRWHEIDWRTAGMHEASVTIEMATGGNMNYVQSSDELLRTRLRQKKIDEELARKEAMVADYGEDEYDDGQVIKFQKRFGDKTYTYAALKAHGGWYVTGETARSIRKWEDLVLYLVGGDHPVSVEEIVDMVENPR